MRAALPITASCLLSPSLGLADESRRALPATLGRLEEFQPWAAQRGLEESAHLVDQARDAERAFDRSQEEIRLRWIEPRFDPLEQSWGTR